MIQLLLIVLLCISPVTYAKQPKLYSNSVAVVDLSSNTLLYGKELNASRSIASITKLMTAIIILDSNLDLQQQITITDADRDRHKKSRSRIPIGTILTRADMIKVSLVASDNRTAHALARTYPGGKEAFIHAMNNRAKMLKMTTTFFIDSTGLRKENVSSANDLITLLIVARLYPLISEYSSSPKIMVRNFKNDKFLKFFNTNRLTRSKDWNINISKTGYTKEAGYCLVMHTMIRGKPILFVLLNSKRKYNKFTDANKLTNWIDSLI